MAKPDGKQAFGPYAEFLASFLDRTNRPFGRPLSEIAGDFLASALERVSPTPKVQVFGPNDPVNLRAPEQAAAAAYLQSLRDVDAPDESIN